jgi:predicted peptidase
MQKIISCFVIVVFSAGMLASCKKSIMPNSAEHNTGVPEIPPIVETDPAVLTPTSVKVSPNILGLYAALPARYNESTQKYPVIFFFHGGGQYGDGHTHLDTVLADGIGKLLRDKTFPPSFTVSSGTYSFIVIIPQLVKRIANFEIDSLVNYAKRNYRIDSSRVYFSGFSLGGRQSADYAAYKPNEIAGVVDMAGMSQMTTTLNGKCQAIADAHLPVWEFHAKNDSAWAYTESVKFVNTINSFSPAIPAKLTVFEKGIRRLNHDCWTQASDPAYKEDDKNIYEWMLSYSR